MKFFRGVLYILILVFFLPGCGYHLIGYGSVLPSHIRTIAIPVLANVSPQPNIHRDATDAIRKRFITDARLKLVDSRTADLLLRGTITDYQLRAVSFSSKDIAEEFVIKIGVQIEAYDRVKKKIILTQKFTTQWDYRTGSGVIDSESARFNALNRAYADLGDRLVSIIIEQF